jgi:rubredoxin
MSDWGICPNCGKEQWLGPSAAIRKLEAEINKAGPADSVGQTAYQPRNASGQFQSQKVDPGGYWLCPACGSKESFEGTTIIKEGSVSVIREIGDTGAFTGLSASRNQEVTVRKCKNCKELLGAKDYVKTPAELARESSGGGGCMILILTITLSAIWMGLLHN